MKGELNLNLSKCLVMDNYHNASPITESIFAHCDPLKETSSDIEKELGDEVNRKTQDKSKEPGLPRDRKSVV